LRADGRTAADVGRGVNNTKSMKSRPETGKSVIFLVSITSLTSDFSVSMAWAVAVTSTISFTVIPRVTLSEAICPTASLSGCL